MFCTFMVLFLDRRAIGFKIQWHRQIDNIQALYRWSFLCAVLYLGQLLLVPVALVWFELTALLAWRFWFLFFALLTFSLSPRSLTAWTLRRIINRGAKRLALSECHSRSYWTVLISRPRTDVEEANWGAIKNWHREKSVRDVSDVGQVALGQNLHRLRPVAVSGGDNLLQERPEIGETAVQGRMARVIAIFRIQKSRTQMQTLYGL